MSARVRLLERRPPPFLVAEPFPMGGLSLGAREGPTGHDMVSITALIVLSVASASFKLVTFVALRDGGIDAGQWIHQSDPHRRFASCLDEEWRGDLRRGHRDASFENGPAPKRPGELPRIHSILPLLIVDDCQGFLDLYRERLLRTRLTRNSVERCPGRPRPPRRERILWRTRLP